MARKSASTSASVSAAPAAVVSVTVTPVVAPEEPKVKVARKSKAAAAAAATAAPAPEPVQVQAPVVEETAAAVPAAVEIASLQSKLSDFGSKIQQIGALHSTLKTEYKLLEKTIAREMKQVAKACGIRKRASGSKQHSGFLKPSQISEELLAFFGKDANTMMSRVEVSKEINEYISSHNLKDTTNGRIIHADAKLSKLLNIGAGENLNFFNLQRYLKHHFIKAVPAAVTA